MKKIILIAFLTLTINVNAQNKVKYVTPEHHITYVTNVQTGKTVKYTDTTTIELNVNTDYSIRVVDKVSGRGELYVKYSGEKQIKPLIF